MGILNTKIMNVALLGKWVIRLYNSGDDDMVCCLLRKNYLTTCTFAVANEKGGSQFWNGLLKIRVWVNWGVIHKVNDGKNTLFWEVTWLNDIPLKLAFPRLFKICSDEKATVYECWDGSCWDIMFRRSFGPNEIAEWDEMMLSLDGIQLDNNSDSLVWVGGLAVDGAA